MTTFCEECEHSHAENSKRPAHRWMCMKFPRIEGRGFVTRESWDGMDPWMYCIGINGGRCPVYEPKRGPQMELGE